METLEPILARHPFFKDLDPKHLAQLVGCASNARFKPGEYIMRENQKAEKFFLIRSGVVSVEVFVEGRGSLRLETLREGDVLGWSWLVEPYRVRFDSKAIEDTLAIALDGWCLRQRCEENKELGYELLKRFSRVIANRLQATRLQLLDMYGDRE